ncbi:MAG: metallophosphoesterase [Pseudomonadales bacterium]
MKLGIVSDTHNNLNNCRKIVELFNAARVDIVVHTGDITQAKTIEVLAYLDMPMTGVFGNNDQERDSLQAAIDKCGFEFMEPPLPLSYIGKKIVVVHDPLELATVNESEFDVILHGHTHRQLIERREGRLTFNPGECAGHMPGHNAIGILDLTSLATEILNF